MGIRDKVARLLARMHAAPQFDSQGATLFVDRRESALAEAGEQRHQLVRAPVDVADDVERSPLLPTVDGRPRHR